MFERISRPAMLASAALVGMMLAGGSLQTLQAQDLDPALVAKGDTVFNRNALGACWSCHGSAGKGTSNGPKLNDSEWLNTDGTLEGIKGIVVAGVPKPKKAKTPMPPMGGAKLSEEEVNAVAAYVVSLAKKKK